MTEEQIKKNDHVPTNEILKDIQDTEKEISLYRLRQQEFPKLSSGYAEHIKERQEFVNSLKEILEYRQRNEVKI